MLVVTKYEEFYNTFLKFFKKINIFLSIFIEKNVEKIQKR